MEWRTRPQNLMQAQTFKLAPGNLGILQTVLTMQQLIDNAATHPEVRDAAVQIVRSAGVAPRDELGELRAVFNWAKKNLRFTGEPQEMISHALVTMGLRAGDCDDFVVLIGSLLRSLGREVRIVTIRADRHEPQRHSHVFLQARANGQWVTLDPSVEGSTFGWTPQPLFGQPSVWGDMTRDLPRPGFSGGLGNFVRGLGQINPTLPTAFPTASTSDIKTALLQIAQDFGAAAASRLAYGKAGGSTVAATGTVYYPGSPSGAQIYGSQGTILGLSGSGLLLGGLFILGLVLLFGKRH